MPYSTPEITDIRFETVMDTVLDGLIIIDDKGLIQSFNRSAEKIFGYDVQEVLGKNVKILMPAPYHAEHDGYLKHHITTGENKVIGVEREVEARRKDGSIFPMEIGVNEMQVQGKTLFVGTVRDITARRSAEKDFEALKQLRKTFDQQTALLKAAEETAKFGHWRYDIKRQNIYWSDQTYVIHGVTPGNYAPELSSAINFYHPDDRAKVEKSLHNAMEKKTWFEFEARLINARGELRHIHSQGEPELDEGRKILALFGTVQDITERKLSEIKMQNARNFLELMLESNPDYIFVKDSNFRIIEANQSFISLYPEEQRDQVIGYTTLEAYNEEEAEGFLENDRIAFETGASETYETIEFPDGDTRTLFTKKVRFENAQGDLFILGIARDVTEREDLIHQLERSNEDLEEFSYIASHDLKEPLRGIHNHAKMIHRDCGESLSEDGQRRLDRVMELTKYMETLISDLLYFSRMGRSDIAWQETDLNKILGEVIGSIPMIEEEHVTVNIPASLPQIFCDRVRVGELFRNLITNAIKYNESEQKHVEIGSMKQRIDSKVQTVLYVKDNGIGIDDEFHHEVFRIFKRLHKKGKYGGGTGAGLTFVHKIVDRHHGKIWIESEKGGGATFYFTLPGDQKILKKQRNEV